MKAVAGNLHRYLHENEIVFESFSFSFKIESCGVGMGSMQMRHLLQIAIFLKGESHGPDTIPDTIQSAAKWSMGFRSSFTFC